MMASSQRQLRNKLCKEGEIANVKKLQLPVDIQLHLYDTCIMPILLYGSEVWGFSNTQNIKVFENQYFMHLIKLGSKSTNIIVLGELGVLRTL